MHLRAPFTTLKSPVFACLETVHLPESLRESLFEYRTALASRGVHTVPYTTNAAPLALPSFTTSSTTTYRSRA